jgi:chemotaxis protein histidine kinase CheA
MADDIVQANIDALNKILNTEKLTKEERAAIDQELFDLRTQLTDTLYAQIDTHEQSRREKLEEDLTVALDMYTMFADSVANLFASITEARLQNIELEQEALTMQMENDLALAEGNEKAKQEIKNKFEKDNAALEAKKKQEQQKAARQEKAVALVQAAIAGALAVVKALGSAPPPATGRPFLNQQQGSPAVCGTDPGSRERRTGNCPGQPG